MSVIVHSRLISGVGNLVERVLAQPQRRVQRTTLAAPCSIVGLCVDKTVVLTVGADPEPVDAILARQDVVQLLDMAFVQRNVTPGPPCARQTDDQAQDLGGDPEDVSLSES